MGIQVNLLPSPADLYINRKGLEKRVNDYLPDALTQLITLVTTAAQRGIETKWRFRGSIVHRICGLHLEKTINDIDVFLELPDWGQAQKVCELCTEIFGSTITKQRSGIFFTNYELKSLVAPIDLTIRPLESTVPDCFSSYTAPMIEVIPRNAHNVDLSLIQSDWVPYCSLQDSFKLIRDNKERITEEHALATPKGLIRHIHSLVKGLHLEKISHLPKLQTAYCLGFFAQYNNARGLQVLADNLKDHVLKHFDLENPQERNQAHLFFVQFAEVIQNNPNIPTNTQRAFIDKQRILPVIGEVHSLFVQPSREEHQPFVRFKTLPDYLEGIKYAQHICEPHHYIPMAEHLMSLLKHLPKDPELKNSLDEHIQLLLKKLGGRTRDKLEHIYRALLNQPDKKGEKKNPSISLAQSVPTLQHYVQKADLLKKTFPLPERVSHVYYLLKKEKKQDTIEELEGCVHSLLLELEADKKDLTPLTLLFFKSYAASQSMIVYWIINSLEKGNEHRSNGLYKLIHAHDREIILQEVCSALEKKLLQLPQQSREVYLNWLNAFFSTGTHFFLFQSFTLLLNNENIKSQMYWITSVYSKVANREKEELNRILSKIILHASYEEALFLHQRMQETPNLFPLPLYFKVFQQVGILIPKDNPSNDFLLQGLDYLNEQEFNPSNKQLLKTFSQVITHAHPTVKTAFCSLMRLPLPNQDLPTVLKNPLLLRTAKRKKIQHIEEEVVAPSAPVSILKKAFSINGLMIAAVGGSIYFFDRAQQREREIFNESFKLAVASTGAPLTVGYTLGFVLKHFRKQLKIQNNVKAPSKYQSALELSSLAFTSFIVKHAPENMNQTYTDWRYIAMGMITGWWSSKAVTLFLLNKSAESLSTVLVQNNSILNPETLNISFASLCIMNSHYVKFLGQYGKNLSFFDFIPIDKVSLYSSGIMMELANFSMFMKKPSLLNRVTLYPFLLIMSYGDLYINDVFQRVIGLCVLKEQTLPRLKNSIKKCSPYAIAATSIHLSNLMFEMYFTLQMFQPNMHNQNVTKSTY